MSDDKEGTDKNVVSLSEVRKEKSKPSVFKTGIEGQWEQYPNKFIALNSHLRHIVTILRTSADHIEASISVRRDIRDSDYDMAAFLASGEPDDEYQNDLMQHQADLHEHEDALAQVIREECLKPLIIDMYEYGMIDMDDIIDTINALAEEEET